MRRQRRDSGRREIVTVDGVEQLFWPRHTEMRQHARREAGRLTAPVNLAHDGPQRETAHPIAAALIAEHVAPSPRSHCVAVAIAAVRDRPGAGDDRNAFGGAHPCLQRDQRVVDDENAGLGSDAAHDAANNERIVRAVDAGDADADARGVTL